MFWLTWSASMQIYWNKRKRLHKKRVQLPEDWFGTPIWPPFHCFRTPIWPPWRHVKFPRPRGSHVILPMMRFDKLARTSMARNALDCCSKRSLSLLSNRRRIFLNDNATSILMCFTTYHQKWCLCFGLTLLPCGTLSGTSTCNLHLRVDREVECQ